MEEKKDALRKQVGGNHYKSLAIQPVEFCMVNGLNFCQSSAIKYICRYKDKGGKEDIDKAIHFLELLKKFEYGDNNSVGEFSYAKADNKCITSVVWDGNYNPVLSGIRGVSMRATNTNNVNTPVYELVVFGNIIKEGSVIDIRGNEIVEIRTNGKIEMKSNQ